MDIIKVENKALKCSDNITKIPVLVVTVSDYEGSHDSSEMFIFSNRIAAHAVGLVTSCGYWVTKANSEAQYELIRSLPNVGQDTTYGDDTGFAVTISPRDPVGTFATCDVNIAYQGATFMRAHPFTGYADFECDLPYILVDENNNLILPLSTQWLNGVVTGSSDPFPLSIAHSKYLITHYSGEGVIDHNFYGACELHNSHHNMNKDLEDPNDPFDDDDDSQPGGGSGGDDQDNWDDDSDPVPVPPLPSLSAVDTGFITLFNPTISQLQNLASYMWSGAFDLNAYRKIVADPMDVIIGLSIVPVDVPASNTAEVMVGNIGTGIYMLKANSQYVEVNCGVIDIHEKDHSYLDYAPYRKCTLVLPYIGAQEIDIDELNGQTMGVIYHVDVLSGACIAYVTIDGNVIHQYSGQCAVSIPITSKDFTQTIMALGQLVTAGISAGVGIAASGGLSAPITAAQVAGAGSSMASGAMNVVNSKPTFSKTGSIGGSTGLLGVQKPYLIFEYPRKCKPAQQQIYTGYPLYVTVKLSDIYGFTQVQDIHLDNIPCTDSERDEMLRMLREGVIL